MMTSKELCAELETVIETSEDDSDIFAWFVRLNKKYKQLLKKGKVDEGLRFELATFWLSICHDYGEDFIYWLQDSWEGNVPVLVSDILDYMPDYSKISYEKYISKMDAFEVEESELLADAIMSRNMRAEISAALYDWDEDVEKMLDFTFPRENAEEFEYGLKQTCAMIIYNRGSAIIRFFAKRGIFELAGVKAFNGNGEWECLSESEVSEGFSDGLHLNEKAIMLKHPKNKKAGMEKEGPDEKKFSLLFFDPKRANSQK